MNITKSIWTAALLAGALVAPLAQAALVTNPADAGSFSVNFDGLVVPPTAPNGPVAIAPGVSVSATGGNLSLGEAPFGAWGLESNGMWSLGKTFAGVDGGVDPLFGAASLTFTFDTPLFAVGGFLNYDPDFVTLGIPEIISIAALDQNGVELESWYLPIATGPDSVNAGAFFAIALDQPLIKKFVVYGPYAVIDNLTYAPVPEPATYVLLLGGLALLGLMGARRRV